MKDLIYRATDAHQELRMFMAATKNIVEDARTIHQTSPVATAALGRLLTAGAMMGAMMKGDKDVLTLHIKGDGPLGSVLITADSKARVKGYVANPMVDLPLKSSGKLDVSGAIGQGFLKVIKDIGMKDPYNGQIELISGEIAEDLTYYFASSEQTPSVVALGVLVDVDFKVKQAGGFILQLMPSASEETITAIEKNLKDLPSITQMFEKGMEPNDIIQRVLAGLEPKVYETIEPAYYCNCSKERVEQALITVGVDEIEKMVADGEAIDMSCHFCETHYSFSMEDLQDILQRLRIV